MGNLIGDLFGSGDAGKAAQQMANNAQQVNQELLDQINSLNTLFGQDFAPLMGPEMQGLLSMLQSVPGFQQQILNPQNAPGLTGFYTGEMTRGLDPTFVGNQYSRLGQQYHQSLNDILAHAGPGSNVSGLMRDAQNSLLSGDVNLAGTLAGENQQVESQGAAGLNQLDTQQLQRILEAFNLPQSALSTIGQYINSGMGLKTAGLGPLSTLGGEYMNAAQQDTQLAAQQQQQMWNSIMQIGTMFATGGLGGGSAPAFGPGSSFANVGTLSSLGNDFGPTSPFADVGTLQSLTDSNPMNGFSGLLNSWNPQWATVNGLPLIGG